MKGTLAPQRTLKYDRLENSYALPLCHSHYHDTPHCPNDHIDLVHRENNARKSQVEAGQPHS
nr:hypothetical protein Iba_chr07eCG12610 [Ipomoea batatas]GMD21164.1 hypothetical protein Iba_chr07fCG11530 [Ipomoea batatas]